MREFNIRNLEEMKKIAAELAAEDIDLLLLIGDMGSGKTTFSKAYGAALGIEGVKSPTFSIVEEHPYEGGVLYHMDLYRIEDEEELLALGFEEYFERPGKVLIEWPQIGLELIPEEALCLEILAGQGEERRLRLGSRKDFGL